MPLAAGTRLGPYEIVAAIGAGGMGEVYKARDTRLDRTVAIKILPPALAADPEFRARFEREARTISALNHPHICTLYDVGDAGWRRRILVMEQLEGETLADRLEKGPLPLDQALDLAGRDRRRARQGAPAGHRPSRFETGERHAVARSARPARRIASCSTSASPRRRRRDGHDRNAAAVDAAAGARTPRPLTAQGTILGTFQYMAPEQIEGADADARTDIWAFGCVLYEMVTGRRAFEGKSQASLIAVDSRTAADADGRAAADDAARARPVVRTCLEKNPDNRFHTAHDLWLHLEWIEEGGSAAGLPAPVVADAGGAVAWIVAALSSAWPRSLPPPPGW